MKTNGQQNENFMRTFLSQAKVEMSGRLGTYFAQIYGLGMVFV